MWSISTATAYGGILLTRGGRILLREPANHYDGYVWTYAKGRPNPGESPDQAALREVREETGYDAEVVDVLPGVFKGGTTTNAFFVMRHIGPPGRPGWESESLRWPEFEDAERLIAMTTNQVGRARDLAILAAARAWYGANRTVVLPDDESRRFAVRRYDSLALDFPAAHVTLPLDMVFDSQGADSIRMGYLPTDPEHKWFHWFDGNVLSMHRRGTGFCLYKVHFQPDAEGLRATHAQVNRQTGQSSGMSKEEDRDLICVISLT